MRILYYDCFSGISGDMNLGAMIDLGVDVDHLKTELTRLNIEGWKLTIQKAQRHGIWGTLVTVEVGKVKSGHRNLNDINRILESSSLDKEVRKIAGKIFYKIAKAEAKVHNVEIDKVHFHEVGAVDSIIDIVGAAICFAELRIDKVIVSEVELGSGTVKCEHGTLPVPAPATAEIIKGIPVTTGGVDFEATTPTGAAIIVTLGSQFGSTSGIKITKTGYGIGQKESPLRPNILRVHLAESIEDPVEGTEAIILESNIDDMNPELYDPVMQMLFEAGASDVFLTPVIMKKSRPGIKITVLCYQERKREILEILFSETTTLGIRVLPVEKIMLQREFRKVKTPFGQVEVKYSFYNGKIVGAKPESDRCIEIAQREQISLKEVYRIIERCIDEEINK